MRKVAAVDRKAAVGVGNVDELEEKATVWAGKEAARVGKAAVEVGKKANGKEMWLWGYEMRLFGWKDDCGTRIIITQNQKKILSRFIAVTKP